MIQKSGSCVAATLKRKKGTKRDHASLNQELQVYVETLDERYRAAGTQETRGENQEGTELYKRKPKLYVVLAGIHRDETTISS